MEQEICNKGLYEEVAKELGVTEILVREIANIQSLFTRRKIESGDRKAGEFTSITYLYLGKIKASEKKLNYINKRNNKAFKVIKMDAILSNEVHNELYNRIVKPVYQSINKDKFDFMHGYIGSPTEEGGSTYHVLVRDIRHKHLWENVKLKDIFTGKNNPVGVSRESFPFTEEGLVEAVKFIESVTNN